MQDELMAWSGNVRILPLEPPQKVEIGIASLPELSPVAEKFFSFMKPHLLTALG